MNQKWICAIGLFAVALLARTSALAAGTDDPPPRPNIVRVPNSNASSELPDDAPYESFRTQSSELNSRLTRGLNLINLQGTKKAFADDKEHRFDALRVDLNRDRGDFRLESERRLLDLWMTRHPGLIEDLKAVGEIKGDRDRVRFAGILAQVDETVKYGANPDDIKSSYPKSKAMDDFLIQLKDILVQVRKDADELAGSKDKTLAEAGRIAQAQLLAHDLKEANNNLQTGIHGCSRAIQGVSAVGETTLTGLDDPFLRACFHKSAAIVDQLFPFRADSTQELESALIGSPHLVTQLNSASAALPNVMEIPKAMPVNR